ncbi:hypothetical protein [Methylosinus sp. KRF6]|uniref:hypothetical protein n=1 Tax=Methylosinus sp. KRF6 TaxID=2846853 RepID=UPI001C0CB33A|nr:hypothetical protein [Methylosinus sp. KRF6]MBU3887593.1 hypothetical protein [Methylosinus sp. KRF6]
MGKLLLSIAFVVVASPAFADRSSDIEGRAGQCLERVAAQSIARNKRFVENDITRRFVASCDAEMSTLVKDQGLNSALATIAGYLHLIAADAAGFQY